MRLPIDDTEKNLMTLRYCDVISCHRYADMDSKDRENIAKEITKTSDLIRKKYRALKIGKMEEDIALERYFKSIIDPLKQIAENTVKSAKDSIMTETFFSRENEELKPKKKRPSVSYDNRIQASCEISVKSIKNRTIHFKRNV